MPFLASFHRGKSDVTVVGESAVIGIWPWNVTRQETHYFPVGEDPLHLFRVGKFQRAQLQAWRLQSSDHTNILQPGSFLEALTL
jgi:hypothetical protein